MRTWKRFKVLENKISLYKLKVILCHLILLRLIKLLNIKGLKLTNER